MNLPGLITVQPDRTEELDALARMVGTCFLEEMWYVTWLEALDELGIGRDRKLEITRAVIRSDYEVTAPYQCVYALPDRAGAANVYLRSELGEGAWVAATGEVPEAVLKAMSQPVRRCEDLILDGMYLIWQKNQK